MLSQAGTHYCLTDVDGAGSEGRRLPGSASSTAKLPGTERECQG